MTETELHIAVADFLAYAAARCLWSHFPAGEKRDKPTAAKLQKMGLHKDWPDFIFLLPNCRTLLIELKTEKGRQTKGQREFAEQAASLGHPYYICRSVTEVETALRQHDIALRATVAV